MRRRFFTPYVLRQADTGGRVYLGGGRQRMGLGRAGSLDAGPRAIALWQDIIPGHPQYLGRTRGGGDHVYQTRRPPCHRRCAVATWAGIAL